MYLIWLYGKVRGILLIRVGEGESKELSLNSKGGQDERNARYKDLRCKAGDRWVA